MTTYESPFHVEYTKEVADTIVKAVDTCLDEIARQQREIQQLKSGIKVWVRTSEELLVDNERLRGIIDEHNKSCMDDCDLPNNQVRECSHYKDMGTVCPGCSKHWKIEL